MVYQVCVLEPLNHFIEIYASVLDMSAAAHADVLFVKSKDDENDLAAYCRREGIKHIIFKDFSEALPIVESVVKGKKTVSEVLG